MKPSVFKMAGAWVWRCYRHAEPCGEEYHDRWPQSWAVCYSAALRHASLFHDTSDPVEEVEAA